jgi:hypothetical protein
MKIASQNNVINSVDFATVVAELEQKYRNIFWTIFEGEAYIYKALGRRDFRRIVSNEELSIEDKKDEIIKACIVYPEDFDIDDCIAGLINVLYSKIMEVSYLNDEESKANVIEYYRQDMYSLDNQITCLINEAFPNFDIEEIENWDLERTAKYLSRAEYKLQNFRGFEFNEAYFQGTVPAEQPQEQQTEEEVKEEIQSKKEKMTPERLRQLQAQFPEIDWANDVVAKGGIDAMGDSVDTTAPALRPGFF